MRRASLVTPLRILVALLITLWLGAELFFPVVAWVAFRVLPDQHTAGLVVRGCLLILHREGLLAGAVLLVLLAAAGAARVDGRPVYERSVSGPILCTASMLLLTAFSQWNVMPRMEEDRLAVSGDINAVPATNSHRLDFERLHVASVRLEGGVLAAGLIMVVLLARTQRKDLPRPRRSQ